MNVYVSEGMLRTLVREAGSSKGSSLSDKFYGSDDHILEYDRLIDDLQRVKKSLRPRKNRESRKEAAKLQGAIETMRYLKSKAQRARSRQEMLT